MSGVKAMIDALNVIYEKQEARSLFPFNFLASMALPPQCQPPTERLPSCPL
jgi:hypothetical protein